MPFWCKLVQQKNQEGFLRSEMLEATTRIELVIAILQSYRFCFQE